MKRIFLTISVAAAVAGMSLTSCGKSGKSEQKGGDTIRIETEEVDEMTLNTKVYNINSAEYCTKVAEMSAPDKYLGTETAIVDFWATWCGPCKALAPVLEQLSAETGVTVYKVDVDQNGDLAGAYKIEYIPALYLCKDGKVTYIPNKGENYSLESLKALIQ